jgi:hypothetical protein
LPVSVFLPIQQCVSTLGLKMLPCVGMKWKAKNPETNVGAGSRHCSTLLRDAITRRTKTAQCEGKEKFFGVWC